MEFTFYKGVIAYQGTNYKGWQSQKRGDTLQEAFEKMILYLWGITVPVQAASRTDAGVHAEGQVIKIFLPMIPIPVLLRLVNNHLPSDIATISLEFCDLKFSPRFDAKKKKYCYTITKKRPLPWDAPFCYHCTDFFDESKLYDMASVFIGKQDFASFGSHLEHGKNTVKEIFFIEINEVMPAVYQIFVTGDSFLRYMVRRMVGGILRATTKKYSKEWLIDTLESKNPRNHCYKVPADGLCLKSVEY